MLVIRPAQLKALGEELDRRLEDRLEQRLMEHTARYFPEAIGGTLETSRETVRNSMRRARSYGFDAPREICKFLNLQFRFGRDFDKDPLCAWAHATLPCALPGVAKMERLYKIALEHEAEARGYYATVGVDNANG